MSTPSSLDYVFPFDRTRIHRVLRPVKARIAAIKATAKLSPCSVSEEDTSTEKVPYRSEGSERHKATVTYERRWKGREGRSTDGDETGSDVANSKPTNRRRVRPFSSSVSNPDLPPHIRLHGLHLRDSFRDAVDKVWSRPLGHDLLAVEVPNAVQGSSCSSSSSNKGSSRWKTRTVLRSGREGVLPLAVLASFAYGARIAECIDDSKSPDEVDNAYGIVPPHLRRFVLLEHTTQLCLRQVPIYGIIEPLIDVCIALGADEQAFRILRHTLKLRFPVQASDYHQIYEKARQIGKSDQLFALLLPRLTADRCQRAAYAEFVSAMAVSAYSVLLASRGLECALQKAAEIGPLKAKRNVKLREWAIMWLQMLLERSSKMVSEDCGWIGSGSFQLSQNVTDTDLDLRNQIMVSLAERALDEEGDPPYPEIAIALGLHCIYLHSNQTLHSPLQHKNVPRSYRLSSFVGPTMVRSMSRLSQTHASPEDTRWVSLTDSSPDMPSRLGYISKVLDEHGQYDMASKLLTHALNHCSALNGNGRELEGLQQFLREVEKKSVEDQKEKWRYEPVMDAWVLRTVTKSDPHFLPNCAGTPGPEPTPTRVSQTPNASLLTILQERRGNTLHLHTSPFSSPLACRRRPQNPLSCDLTDKENKRPSAPECASPLDRRKKVEHEPLGIRISQSGIFSPAPCSLKGATSSFSPIQEKELRGAIYRKCNEPMTELDTMNRRRERTCSGTPLSCEISSHSSTPFTTSPFLTSVSLEGSQPHTKRLRSGTTRLAHIESESLESLSAPCSARTTRSLARTEKERSRRSSPKTRLKESNRTTATKFTKARGQKRRATDVQAIATESGSETDAGSKSEDTISEDEPDEEESDRDFHPLVRRSRRSLGSRTGTFREWWKVDHDSGTRRTNGVGTRGSRESSFSSHRNDHAHIGKIPAWSFGGRSFRSPVSPRRRRSTLGVRKPNEKSSDEHEEEEEEEASDDPTDATVPFIDHGQINQADELESDVQEKSSAGPSRRLSIHVGEALPITEEVDDLAFL